MDLGWVYTTYFKTLIYFSFMSNLCLWLTRSETWLWL